jgi:hypothetical protein
MTEESDQASGSTGDGAEGVPDKAAEVNFAELAEKEAESKAKPRPRGAPPEVPLPCKPPLPDELAEFEERERSAPPDEDLLPDDEDPDQREPGGSPSTSAPARGSPSAVDEQPAFGITGGPPTLEASFPAAEYSGIVPPDVAGAAGPNHLLVAHNGVVRIQNKAGGVLSTVTLDGFWSPVAGSGGTFDPKVLYDGGWNRWIITAADDALSASSSGLLIGVSQTDDPTGNWTLRKITIGAADGAWADHPSIGFTSRWVVVQVNMAIGLTFARSHIYVFEKTDLVAGGSGAFTLLGVDPEYGGGQVPAIGDPSNPRPQIFLLQTLAGNWSGTGFLRLWRVVRFVRELPGSPPMPYLRLQRRGVLARSNVSWADQAAGGAELGPQLGSTQRIDLGDTRIRNNVVCRPGVVYDYLFAAHTVFLPAGAPTRSAVQFWVVRTNFNVDELARIDDPVDLTCFAYPSLAVTALQSVLLGFSRFSNQAYPTANWAFRWSTDPPNTLTMGGVLRSGDGAYFNVSGGTVNRWGDYTSTCLDPGGVPAIWTLQEYARPPVGTDNQSGRWGTWWGKFEFFEIG